MYISSTSNSGTKLAILFFTKKIWNRRKENAKELCVVEGSVLYAFSC